MALVLEKYRELDKASAFSSMHKSKQAEVWGCLRMGWGLAWWSRTLGRSPGQSSCFRCRSYGVSLKWMLRFVVLHVYQLLIRPLYQLIIRPN